MSLVLACVLGHLHIPKAGGMASSEGTSMYAYIPPQRYILVFILSSRRTVFSMFVS